MLAVTFHPIERRLDFWLANFWQSVIQCFVSSGMQQHPSPAPSISTLNFSSIWARLPGSRFLAHLRREVYQSPIDVPHPVESVAEEWITETSLDVDTSSVAPGAIASTPGGWAFFASGYMLGLLVMVSQI